MGPFSFPSAHYPSPPPSIASSDDSAGDIDIMVSNSTANVDGVGTLNYQRAIDIARNTEGDLDPAVSDYLEGVVNDIWGRIQSQPNTYILSRDEFAVFNYYRQRFSGEVAEQAVDRYWRCTTSQQDQTVRN